MNWKLMGWPVTKLALRGLALMLMNIVWAMIAMAIGLGGAAAFVSTGGQLSGSAGMLMIAAYVVISVIVSGLFASYVVEKWIR